jgi:hypothetical protein
VKNFGPKCLYLVFLFVPVATLSSLIQAQQISLTPSALSFGNIGVGASKSQTVVVKNITKRKIGIFQASVNGAGYTISGLTCPVAIAAGQRVSFTVTFTPPAPATDNGVVSLVTDNWWKVRRDTPLTTQLPLSGSGVAGGQIAASPTSVAFGNVMVGGSQTAAVAVTNTGSAGLTISQVALSNAAFSVSGIVPPVGLAAGQSLTFSAIFAPGAGGAASGNLAIFSDAQNGQLNVSLTGVGVTPGQLSLAPLTYDFGNVNTGQSATASVTLTAVGSTLAISSASSTSPEFVLSGAAFPVTLANGQSISFTVTFLPQVSGTASGSVSFFSNAANSPSTEALTGTGVAPVQHSADLSWNGSATPGVVGYNVYRGTVHGGPYSKITNSPDPSLTYSDATVDSGKVYYYVITAQDGNGVESTYSNEAEVVVPSP